MCVQNWRSWLPMNPVGPTCWSAWTSRQRVPTAVQGFKARSNGWESSEVSRRRRILTPALIPVCSPFKTVAALYERRTRCTFWPDFRRSPDVTDLRYNRTWERERDGRCGRTSRSGLVQPEETVPCRVVEGQDVLCPLCEDGVVDVHPVERNQFISALKYVARGGRRPADGDVVANGADLQRRTDRDHIGPGGANLEVINANDADARVLPKRQGSDRDGRRRIPGAKSGAGFRRGIHPQTGFSRSHVVANHNEVRSVQTEVGGDQSACGNVG